MDTIRTHGHRLKIGLMVVTLPNSEAPIEMDIDLSYFIMEKESSDFYEGFYGNIYIRIHKSNQAQHDQRHDNHLIVSTQR